MDEIEKLKSEIEILKSERNEMIEHIKILYQNNTNAIKSGVDMPTSLLRNYLAGFLNTYKPE